MKANLRLLRNAIRGKWLKRRTQKREGKGKGKEKGRGEDDEYMLQLPETAIERNGKRTCADT